LKRCEQILREGLSLAGVRDRADVAERLADLLEEQGRHEEVAEFWREAEAAAPTSETTLDIRSGGKVLRQNTQVKYGGTGLHLRELPNLAALLRESSASAPVTRQKIGRNQPCPCGSGKKFKKCCGAQLHRPAGPD
jgi:preprotein translocase subunit SecA